MPKEPFIYKSRLDNWDSRASVRNSHRRVLREEEEDGKIYFPPELTPIVLHAHVESLGADITRQILVQRLYSYLIFTTKLERQVINPIVLRIADNDLDLRVPAKMRRDADKIYTDEAWHAQFSNDLLDQVHQSTEILPLVQSRPQFLAHFENLLENSPVHHRPLIATLFTIVSETLISAILGSIPKDPRIVSAVREEVADHAKDEATHHRFFSDFLMLMWPQLTPAQKDFVGPLIPKFITWFLEPDLGVAYKSLENLDLSPKEILKVIQEGYPEHQVISDIRIAAKHSIALFKNNGLFDDSATEDAFFESGLILP